MDTGAAACSPCHVRADIIYLSVAFLLSEISKKPALLSHNAPLYRRTPRRDQERRGGLTYRVLGTVNDIYIVALDVESYPQNKKGRLRHPTKGEGQGTLGSQVATTQGGGGGGGGGGGSFYSAMPSIR